MKLSFSPADDTANAVISPDEWNAGKPYFTLIGGGTNDQQNELASVFVAAPDLLAALQCALFDLEQTYCHVNSVTADRIKSETIPLARAAIAKATPQTQRAALTSEQ